MAKELKIFTSNNCEPCKMLKAMLPKLYMPIPISILDVDANPHLFEEYNMTGVPALIMFEDGIEIKRLNGFVADITYIKDWLNV